MTALSAPIDLIQPATTSLNPAAHVSRAKIDSSSKQFESQFLSVMFGQMFEGTEVSAPFGGGEGEAAFKSFLTDAMAKSVVKSGGIGLAKDIAKEMLKMQGLSPEPTATPAASSGLAMGAYGAAGQLSPLLSGRPAKAPTQSQAQAQTTSTKQ